MIAILVSCLISACGGGGTAGSQSQAPSYTSSQSGGTGTTAADPGSTGSASNDSGTGTGTGTGIGTSTDTGTVNPGKTDTPPDTASNPTQTTSAFTKVEIVNTSATAETQSNVPVTFGQVFRPGEISASNGISLTLADGTSVPFQLDIKARNPDGSLRHGIISMELPRLPAGKSEVVTLSKTGSAAPTSSSTSPTALLNAGFTASVNLNIGGKVYSASADELLRTGKYTTWLSGPVVNEWLVSAPLKTADGVEHPHLAARFAIRSYAGINKARVDVTVENDWAYEPSPQNFTYDADIHVGGKSVYSKTGLTHFAHARWRKIVWWGAVPEVDVKHDIAYLIASKAVPNYDTSITISSTGLSNLEQRWNSKDTGPMGPGIVTTAMPMVGGRPDIGPLPQWAAMYLLSMDPRAEKVTLGVGDLAGSWPIHYRDKKTDRLVSLTDYPYMTLLGHPGDAVNPATGKSELFPACGGDCSTTPYNYNPDTNHQPSMAYLPYLVTGDYYYLEELQFWANWNMLQANPYYRDFDKGVTKWNEIRGQAWTLRTLGQVAYITPDNDPMKRYFVDRVGYNLDFYNSTYTIGKPNQLGVIDGSGKYAFAPMAYTTASGVKTGLAPWMDDFFTWSVGYLSELGFADATPLLAWKSKFPIGRMTAPGYCWIDGATYELAVRPSSTSPLYSTLAEAYQATMRNLDGTPMVNSTGARYLDQACGSQAQADWRTQQDRDAQARRGPWAAGEMTGYATSPEGYPSNMQPALAVAATSGVPNAQSAWNVFINRPLKPDYSVEPQWAIVPRN